MSDYPMLISNKLHSFRNFDEQIKQTCLGKWRQIAYHFISNQVKSPGTGTKRKFCLRYHNYYQPLCIHIDATLRRTATILNKDTPTKSKTPITKAGPKFPSSNCGNNFPIISI